MDSPIIPTKGYACFVIYVASSPGGHIYNEEKGGSFCGIEKRLPNNDVEQHHHDEKFPKWYEDNCTFVCQLCNKAFLKCIKGKN